MTLEQMLRLDEVAVARKSGQETHTMGTDLTTPSGVPIVDCDDCGKQHPVTRTHCEVCGSASLFRHEVHARG